MANVKVFENWPCGSVLTLTLNLQHLTVLGKSIVFLSLDFPVYYGREMLH